MNLDEDVEFFQASPKENIPQIEYTMLFGVHFRILWLAGAGRDDFIGSAPMEPHRSMVPLCGCWSPLYEIPTSCIGF